jgi:hypothetical protein
MRREVTVWKRAETGTDQEEPNMASDTATDRTAAIGRAIDALRPYDGDDEVASVIEALVALGEGEGGEGTPTDFLDAERLLKADPDEQRAYLASFDSAFGERSTRRQIEGIRKVEQGGHAA